MFFLAFHVFYFDSLCHTPKHSANNKPINVYGANGNSSFLVFFLDISNTIEHTAPNTSAYKSTLNMALLPSKNPITAYNFTSPAPTPLGEMSIANKKIPPPTNKPNTLFTDIEIKYSLYTTKFTKNNGMPNLNTHSKY